MPFGAALQEELEVEVEKWNIIEILKLGFPGLVFLLSMLSYLLLANEQKKGTSDPRILNSIKNFMYINFFLAILTVASPVIEHVFFPENLKEFSIQARRDNANLEPGNASVCTDSSYTNRYLLVFDKDTERVIQVFSKSLTPCHKERFIRINQQDAQALGWKNEVTQKNSVEVALARPGFKFVLDTPNP